MNKLILLFLLIPMIGISQQEKCYIQLDLESDFAVFHEESDNINIITNVEETKVVGFVTLNPVTLSLNYVCSPFGEFDTNRSTKFYNTGDTIMIDTVPCFLSVFEVLTTNLNTPDSEFITTENGVAIGIVEEDSWMEFLTPIKPEFKRPNPEGIETCILEHFYAGNYKLHINEHTTQEMYDTLNETIGVELIREWQNIVLV